MKISIFLMATMVHHHVTVYGSPLNYDDNNNESTIFNPFINDDIIEELNVDDNPYLWQMAAFASRQMSDKRIKYKLMTLTAAEKIDSIYRLRVTLKRINNNDNVDAKNNVLYCTVEVNAMNDGQQLEMENFGCTIPAVIRIRDRNMEKSSSSPSTFVSNSVDKNVDLKTTNEEEKQEQQQPKYQPLNNVISNERIIDTIDKLREQKLRQTFSPFLYRQHIFATTMPQQTISYYQPRPTYSYQEVRPNYRFYY